MNGYTPISHSVQALKGAQTWKIQEYGHLLTGAALPARTRIVVEIDHSYTSQGHARLEYMTAAGWQPAAFMFGGEAKKLAAFAERYQRDGDRDTFAPIINELARRAQELLT